MSRLPQISGRELGRIPERQGFVFVRQKGSHRMMRRMTPPSITVSVPDHKELAPGTLRGILRDVNMSVEELQRLIKQK